MRVGFYLYYRRHDHVQASLRLADLCRASGLDVALHTTADNKAKVDSRWDSHVTTDSEIHFIDWVKSCQTLVWPEPVPSIYLSHTAQLKCRNILFGLWDCVIERYKDSYEMADVIVCPCKQAAELFRENWQLKNVMHIPWDAGLPLTRKSTVPDSNRLRILMPLHESQTARCPSDTLDVIWWMLNTFPFVDLTFLYTAKNWNARGHNLLKALDKRFRASGQFQKIQANRLSRQETLVLYGRHDITLWPALFEGIGLVGLESLHMGTPVVAYDIMPQSDYLHDRKNSLLIPCDLNYDPFGTPSVKYETHKLKDAIAKICTDRDLVSDLTRYTRFGLSTRREQFLAGWKKVLAL